MARFEITGANKLSGDINVAGNKNSVLPMMAACLLTEETCVLENVPHISDVDVMAKLLEIAGATVSKKAGNKLAITCQNIKNSEFPSHLTEKLRASVLLLTPLLLRLGKIKMGYPCGDIIGRRSLDSHIQVLKSLGAKVEEENDLITAQASSLKATDIFLQEASVTATENAILAAVIGGKIGISPVVKNDLDMILLILKKFGVEFKIENEKLIVSGSKLNAVEKVSADIWPGFPTDLMAPMIVLATQAQGATLLHDWMYESRMFFVDKLLSMGAKVEIADPHRVLVYGPTKLHCQRLDTPDIRAGMALVIAALAAQGKSVIDKAELIERGYENIAERLAALGAKIKRLD